MLWFSPVYLGLDRVIECRVLRSPRAYDIPRPLASTLPAVTAARADAPPDSTTT